VIWLLLCITDILAVCLRKRDSETVTTPFWKWLWIECQYYWAMHFGLSKWQHIAMIFIRSTECLFRQNNTWRLHYPIMKLSVKGVSNIFGLVSHVIQNDFVLVIYTRSNGSLYGWKRKWQYHCPILKLSIQKASTIFWSWLWGNCTLIWSLLCIKDLLAAYICKRGCNIVTGPFWQHPRHIMEMSINRASTVWGFKYWLIKTACRHSSSKWKYWRPK